MLMSTSKIRVGVRSHGCQKEHDTFMHTKKSLVLQGEKSKLMF